MNTPIQTDRFLEMLIEEYKQLKYRFDELIDSSFSDFRLLASIGALIAWPPLATSDLLHTTQEGLTLLVGFIGILFLIVIIAVRDMLKWTIIEFYLKEMRLCEQEIKKHLNSEFQGFQFAHRWPKHYREHYFPVFSRFSLLFVILLIFLPAGVFYFRTEYFYLTIYLVVFSVVFGIYLWAARALGAI